MCGWHIPAAYDYALAHPWAHRAEHLTMIVAGLAVWMHIVGILPRIRMSHARRAGYALGLLAVTCSCRRSCSCATPSTRVYVEQPDRLLGLSPTADQTRAALIMTAEQMLTLLTAAALLLWAHVDRAAAERDAGSVAAPPPPARPRALSGSPRRIGATGRPRRHSAARRRGRRHRRRCPAEL